MTEAAAKPRPGPLEQLPGELMTWVLVISELLVFGAGLAAFLAVRIFDPAGFAEARTHVHGTLAGINTIMLITSGYLAARALSLRLAEDRGAARWNLAGAMALGTVFLVIKAYEYADLGAAGITTETHLFFMLYYLLTGFHAIHVLAGVLLLGLVAWRDSPGNIEIGTTIWHMIDLVWVLLFPVLYLLG